MSTTDHEEIMPTSDTMEAVAIDRFGGPLHGGPLLTPTEARRLLEEVSPRLS